MVAEVTTLGHIVGHSFIKGWTIRKTNKIILRLCVLCIMFSQLIDIQHIIIIINITHRDLECVDIAFPSAEVLDGVPWHACPGCGCGCSYPEAMGGVAGWVNACWLEGLFQSCWDQLRREVGAVGKREQWLPRWSRPMSQEAPHRLHWARRCVGSPDENVRRSLVLGCFCLG